MGTRALNRRWRVSAVVACLLAGIAVGSHADADPPPSDPEAIPWGTVVVRAPSCNGASFDDAAFRHLLEIELLGEHLRMPKNEEAGRADFVVEIQRLACDAETREVPIKVRTTETGAEIARTIALGDVGLGARPRALALAVAELVRETRAARETRAEPRNREGAVATAEKEPARTAPPESAPAPPAPRPETAENRPAPPEPPLPKHVAAALQVSFDWQTFAPDRTSLPGVGVAAAIPMTALGLLIRANATGLWGRIDDELGSVDLSYYGGGVAVLAATRGSPTIVLGPHLQLGYARAKGVAHFPSQVKDDTGGQAILTGSLLAGVHASLYSRWAAVIELELGMAAHGFNVKADDRQIAALKGGFATARMGVAFEF